MTVTCHICKKDTQPHPMGDRDGYRFVACKACGSVFVETWMTEDVREKFFGEIQPQITHVPNPQGEINHIKKTLEKLTPAGQAGRRFLDVGCRNGYAVVAAKELGFDARGIDTHEFFIDFARKNYDPALFEHTSAAAFAEAGNQAEVIFVRECFLEQIDPDAFVAALSQLLAPGGEIYIEEPDGNSFNVPTYFPSWEIVFPPMNFAYYSKKGMTALLKRHGLKVKKTLFNWRPVMRMLVTKA